MSKPQHAQSDDPVGFVSDQLCEDIRIVSIESAKEKLKKRAEVFRSYGDDINVRVAKALERTLEVFESKTLLYMDYRTIATYADGKALAEVLARHGIEADASTAMHMIRSLPGCESDVMVELGIEKLKQRLQQPASPAVCAVQDDRLGEFEPPSVAAIEALKACAGR